MTLKGRLLTSYLFRDEVASLQGDFSCCDISFVAYWFNCDGRDGNEILNNGNCALLILLRLVLAQLLFY